MNFNRLVILAISALQVIVVFGFVKACARTRECCYTRAEVTLLAVGTVCCICKIREVILSMISSKQAGLG